MRLLCLLRRELGYERGANLAPTIGGDAEMSLRVIPTSVHGMIDYAATGALYATPTLLEPGDVPASARTLRLAGGAAIAYSLVTDYEFGVVKVVPMPVHLTLDVMSGALLASSPWLFGFAKEGPRHWLPHALMGAKEIVIALMSKTR
jgi:hypothetical protein